MPMLRYDYDSVLERLKQRVLRKLGGQNIILYSTNAAFIEAAAEEFDDLAMYDEFLTRENVWDTARGNSSIMKQAGFYDYRPHRKIGAAGLIRFSASENFDGNWPLNVAIPKWTQVSGGGVTFLTKADFFLPAASNFVDIPVIQGEISRFSTTIEQASFPQPKGAAWAQIRIADPDIENNLYEARVNGELWKEIGTIRLAVQEAEPEKAKVYAVKTAPRYEGVILFFGNDMLGKSLQYGDNVEFTYLKTEGARGNVLSAGIVNAVDGEVFDEQGNGVQLFCSNLSALTGGRGYEELADIKINAPRSFQTGKRAISSLDYEILIKETGAADNVQVWGEKEINEDLGNPPGTFLEASANLIYITGYTVDAQNASGATITESAKRLIREHLNDKKGSTDILQFVDTQIIYVTFHPTVFMSDARYTPQQVKEFVNSALWAEYSILKGKYKTGLFHSDYISAIDRARGVNHCTCVLSFSVMALFSGAYEFHADINLNNIKKNSVSVKIKNDSGGMGWRELARDDGSGNLVGAQVNAGDPREVYQLPGARVNYNDGSIGDVKVIYGLSAPFSNYQIRIDFELDDAEEGNLKPTLRNQIYAMYSSDIQTRLMI